MIGPALNATGDWSVAPATEPESSVTRLKYGEGWPGPADRGRVILNVRS